MRDKDLYQKILDIESPGTSSMLSFLWKLTRPGHRHVELETGAALNRRLCGLSAPGYDKRTKAMVPSGYLPVSDDFYLFKWLSLIQASHSSRINVSIVANRLHSLTAGFPDNQKPCRADEKSCPHDQKAPGGGILKTIILIATNALAESINCTINMIKARSQGFRNKALNPAQPTRFEAEQSQSFFIFHSFVKPC